LTLPLYSSLKEIDRLTSKFREGIIQPDGSRVLKHEHIEYQEMIHFDLPNLDYDVLFELPRFLVRTTIFPSGARYGNADQPHFLTWMAEICNYKWDFKFQDKRFRHLFDLLVSSHLADVSSLPSSLNYYLVMFLNSFHTFAACFTFPFLERCIRMKCYKFVRDDGFVLEDFDIPRYGRGTRPYRRGQYISNISDELKLLAFYVAMPEFRARLDRFMDELNEDSWIRLDDPYELIGRWRNTLLHGEHVWSSGWDAATYLVCMILLSEIGRKNYELIKNDIKQLVKWKQKTASPFLWYPYTI